MYNFGVEDLGLRAFSEVLTDAEILELADQWERERWTEMRGMATDEGREAARLTSALATALRMRRKKGA